MTLQLSTTTALALGALAGLALGGDVAAADGDAVRITVLQVWAAKKTPPAAVPADLVKHEKLLRERTREKGLNSFALEGKPAAKAVKPGEKTEHALPDGYKLTLTPRRAPKDPGDWTLDFVLSREKDGFVSQLRIDISDGKPCVILPALRRGEEQLILLLTYELPGK